MDISTASLDVGATELPAKPGVLRSREGVPTSAQLTTPPDQETLRRIAWDIGEQHSLGRFCPPNNFVGLAMVHPVQGFAYWRLLPEWIDQVRQSRVHRWDGSRPILRLYDVSYLEFTGLNAHRIQDEPLPCLAGSRFFNLPRSGTWQIGEIGMLLRDGEFVPAYRSQAIPFAPDSPSRNGGSEALLVTGPRKIESVANIWDAEHELRERCRPRLRHPLRIAALALASRHSGQEGPVADFVTELAQGIQSHQHEVHVFVPQSETLTTDREIDGVHFHPLKGVAGKSPLELARSFSDRVQARLDALPPFDLIHLHEWMTGLGGWIGQRPSVLSLSSIEVTRRTGPVDEQSRQIEEIEKQVATSVGSVLAPSWLRDRLIAEFGLNPGRVHPFAMEGRLANEWETPLDPGQVKMRHGIGPLDRSLLFIGPLEHAAGVDILVEAVPVLLRRWGNLRLAIVGNGPMQDALERRAHDLGVHWAIRFLGHKSGLELTQLLRSSEALVLPARFRMAMDDAVVDLARKAARPIITTHGGPSHLVRHEEDGLLTYDNPGSMVWAIDRLLGDPGHAERMGQHGRRSEGGTLRWNEVAQAYLEACVNWFPELTVTRL